MGNILRVSVVSTGSVQIRPQHVERDGSPVAWWLLTSRRFTEPRPINVYVIEHDEGLVLFDTGQDRLSITDPDYFPRGLARWLYSRLARFEIAAHETLPARLMELGYDVSNVRYAILSHLHQDHIGGLRYLPDAQILVDARERAEVLRPAAEFRGLLKRHIQLPGLRWSEPSMMAVDDPSIAPFHEAHDVFDDGTLLIVPTPGHTPGSLSLLLRQAGSPTMLLVGDLTYDASLLARGRVPGIGRAHQLRESSRAVTEYVRRNPGTVVLGAHDPAASGALAAALAGSAS